jgi:hypothetical protein
MKLIIIIISFIIAIYLINFINIKKTNNNYEILQKYKPNRNEIITIIRNKLPTILVGIIEDWFIYDENDNIDHNKLTKDVLNDNTKLLNNIFTVKKKYEINHYNNHNSKIIQERNVSHYLCVLTGNLSLYLFNPEQKIEYKKNELGIKESIHSFWNEEKKNLSETNYIEVKLDTEKILYIPYGWWYCFKNNDDSLVLDIYSDTILTLPLKMIL